LKCIKLNNTWDNKTKSTYIGFDGGWLHPNTYGGLTIANLVSNGLWNSINTYNSNNLSDNYPQRISSITNRVPIFSDSIGNIKNSLTRIADNGVLIVNTGTPNKNATIGSDNFNFTRESAFKLRNGGI